MAGNGKRRFAAFNTTVGTNCGDSCSCSSSPPDSSSASSSASGSDSSSGSPSAAESDTSGANSVDGLIRNAAKRVGIPLAGNDDDSDNEEDGEAADGADGDADESDEDGSGDADEDGGADSHAADAADDGTDGSGSDDADDDSDEPTGNAFPDVPDVGVLTKSAEGFDASELHDVGAMTSNDDASDRGTSWMHEGMDWGSYLHDAGMDADGDADDSDEPTGNNDGDGGVSQFGNTPGAGANRIAPDSLGGDSSDDDGSAQAADAGGFHDVGALTANDGDDGDDGGATPASRSGTFAGRAVGPTGNAGADDGEFYDVGTLTAMSDDG